MKQQKRSRRVVGSNPIWDSDFFFESHLKLISYFKYVRSTHGYCTRSNICNDVLTPSCKRNSGLRTFHSSTCPLWNNLGNSYRNIISHSNFRITLQSNFITENTLIEHFEISRTF